jgi:DHA3 family macrolide efflux protein-like MFS transporter
MSSLVDPAAPPSSDLSGDGATSTHDIGPWKLRYWSIFLGQGTSLIGSALTQFVLIWWITDTVGSVTALAIAGLFALLPQALLAPLGGAIADRYSRRFIMIAADSVSALCMAVLVWLFLTDQVALWHLYTMMAIRSAMQAFQSPAAQASTAMLVPAHFLPRAAGFNQTLTGLMIVAAVPLGALAIGFLPIGWALAIDVITALFGIVPVLLFAIPQKRPDPESEPHLWREFVEGLGFVRGNPMLWRLYALDGAVVFLLMPAFTLVPLLVKTHFGGGPTEVALLEGIGGSGMLIGGLIIAALTPKRPVMWFVTGSVLSCATMGLTALVPGNLLWLAIIFWTLSWLTWAMGSAPYTAMLQATIPNQIQGRVLSLRITIIALSGPVGLAVMTPVGEAIGVRWLFVVAGFAGALVSMLGYVSPVLRKAP